MRPHREHVRRADLVGTDDAHARAERGHRLDDVVRERIVVVKQQHRRTHSADTSRAPRADKTAPALARHSASSLSGRESATMPAPARTTYSPSRAYAARRVMQASRPPS